MTDQIEIISPVQDYNFVESWYELSDESHFWFQGRIHSFLRQLDDFKIPTQSDWKVLDVGCGTGVLRKQVEQSTNWTVDASDLDYNALKHSKGGRGRTIYYDITEQDSELKEQYDAILLFDVLEHIEDTQPFIKSLLFHLKPGGYLFINVPALQNLFSLYDSVQGHYRRYNKESLRKEFDDTSLKTIDARYWGMANIPIIWLRKHWLSLTAKNKSNDEIFSEGFSPPNKLINSILLGVMNAETKIIPRPILGTSVLMIGRKD